MLLSLPVLGLWAAGPVHRVTLWISGPGEIGFKIPLPRGGFQPFCSVPWDNVQHMAAV